VKISTFALGLMAALALAAGASAAELGAMAQSVLPASTRQLVSVDYHRLADNPLAAQIEKQVLPDQMQNIVSLLRQGGVDPSQDLNRLTFATYSNKSGIGLVAVAEGNFEGFKTSAFFHPTERRPAPAQYNGTDYYSADGLTFFLPDSSTLVFGGLQAIHDAIDVIQGVVQPLSNNSSMVNLISGTQTTDIWSVLDAAGARGLVAAMASGTGKFDANALANHFDGARYTIEFDQNVKVNLELMTDDPMSAGLASTGLRAAVLYKQYQAKDPALKNLLSQIQVDSAGNDAFLQVESPQATVANLLNTDLFKSIMR